MTQCDLDDAHFCINRVRIALVQGILPYVIYLSDFTVSQKPRSLSPFPDFCRLPVSLISQIIPYQILHLAGDLFTFESPHQLACVHTPRHPGKSTKSHTSHVHLVQHEVYSRRYTRLADPPHSRTCAESIRIHKRGLGLVFKLTQWKHDLRQILLWVILECLQITLRGCLDPGVMYDPECGNNRNEYT